MKKEFPVKLVVKSITRPKPSTPTTIELPWEEYEQFQTENEKLTALARYVLNCGLISRLQAAKASGFTYKEIGKYQAKSEAEADEIIRKGFRKGE